MAIELCDFCNTEADEFTMWDIGSNSACDECGKKAYAYLISLTQSFLDPPPPEQTPDYGAGKKP